MNMLQRYGTRVDFYCCWCRREEWTHITTLETGPGSPQGHHGPYLEMAPHPEKEECPARSA